MNPAPPSAGAGAAVAAPRLKYFPLSWFSMVMGLTGFTIAVGKGEKHLGWPGAISPVLLAFTALIAVVLTLLYALKIARHRSDVVEEIRHPVKLAFVPTFSISLSLLSVATLHTAPQWSRVFWLVGAVAHLGLTLYVLSSWMHHDRYQIQHLNPAWFIPVVGNILVPIAGIQRNGWASGMDAISAAARHAP